MATTGSRVSVGNINGGWMLSIMPAKRTAQSPAFQIPILMRRQRRERMIVKRGVVNIMVRASPRGRKTRLL